jgi:hypothetical protein
MALSLPTPTPSARAIHDERSLAVGTVYGEYLSRAARLQVIESIAGLSPGGAAGQVRSSQPMEWLSAGHADGRHWLFDPALLDAAGQMAALWSRTYRDEGAVQTRYGRVVRYRHPLPARLQWEFTPTDSPDSSVLRGTVVFTDSAGETVLLVDDLEITPVAATLLAAGDAAAAESLPA